MENPRGAQLHHVPGIDLTQAAVATPRVIAVVGSPVRANRPRQQVFCPDRGNGGEWKLALLRLRWDSRTDHTQQIQNACATQIHFNTLPPSAMRTTSSG